MLIPAAAMELCLMLFMVHPVVKSGARLYFPNNIDFGETSIPPPLTHMRADESDSLRCTGFTSVILHV